MRMFGSWVQDDLEMAPIPDPAEHEDVWVQKTVIGALDGGAHLNDTSLENSKRGLEY